MTELKPRDQVNPADTWNLTTIYTTDTDWQTSHDEVRKDLQKFDTYKGKLGDSAKTLAELFALQDSLGQEMGKLYVYAHLSLDQDTQNNHYQGMADKARNLNQDFEAVTSFISPELLAVPQDTIKAYMSQEASLAVYAHYFDDLWRQQAHVLSPDQEELLAKAGVMSNAAQKIFTMLDNADLTFEAPLDKDGNPVPLSHGNFIGLLMGTDRTLRKNAFDNYYDSYVAHKNTIAAAYGSSVSKDVFFAQARGYDSALQAALFADNIPTDVYSNLVNAVNDGLPALHKYVGLRKKALGLSDLNMYDIFVPLIADADNKVTYAEAQGHIMKALAPLGEEYLGVVCRLFDERWVDKYENQNKRSGAYCWGSYATNPFVLMNYDDTTTEMFTLAHEIGHAIHNYYTHETQPYTYGSYTVFLAEIASTVNEALLMDYLLNTVTDTTMQKFLLNYFIDQFRVTLFRQTMFAEFEMLTHQMAENNEPLTGEVLNDLYKGLVEKQFGPEMNYDDKIAYEWSRIPHFYNAFYVFQYATGLASAMAISKAILDGEKSGDMSAKNAYLELLRSGSSDYSVELLKKAGVDMTTAKPIQDAVAIFSDLVDRFEKVLEV